MSRTKHILLPAIATLGWSVSALSQTVIGIVNDGPLSRPVVDLAHMDAEVRILAGDEFDIRFPADKRLDGGWSLAGIRSALQSLLDDDEVDIVVTTGFIASNEAARIDVLPKPVIAVVVADAKLQELPVRRVGNSVVSGKTNLVYLARISLGADEGASFDRTNIDEAIEVFHDAVRFGHLAVLIDRLTIESVPGLTGPKAQDVAARLGIRTTVIPFTGTVDSAVAAIPADADAVLVGPLMQLDATEMRSLANALIARRLPNFSLLGRSELQYGLLMASGGRDEDSVRYSRRVALNVQRILLGDDAGGIDVRIAEPQRLAINMQTASAIGYYPRYAVLSDAEQVNAGGDDDGEPLGLRQAMAEALDANLELRVAAMEPAAAAEQVRLARSRLFPNLGIGVRATQIDEDRANPLFQSERSVNAQVTGSQMVYSDEYVAGAAIAVYQESAAHYGYEVEVLDTLQDAAGAYLTVLRAKALETVRRANLEVTRANLAFARLRQSIGASGRSDALRWESQLAVDRQDVVAAEADRRVALTGLNRLLNRPQNREFRASDDDMVRALSLFQDPRFRAFVDNAAVWERFQNFSVSKTLAESPELARIDQLRAAQSRRVLASKRRYYVPELTLNGMLGTNLSRGGAGSDVSQLGLDDESWTLALSASWPLFTGGALRAQLNQDRFDLERIERSRSATAAQLEARTRTALHRASSTYPSMEFSSEAAAAAAENLELVIDAYRTGTVSVTDLIDAQNAALSAELRAVDARYAYLLDVVDVLRATADFSLLVDPGSAEAWFQEVESYLRAASDSVSP